MVVCPGLGRMFSSVSLARRALQWWFLPSPSGLTRPASPSPLGSDWIHLTRLILKRKNLISIGELIWPTLAGHLYLCFVSFKTSKGVGYSAHFVGNCLVLTSMKVNIKILLQSQYQDSDFSMTLSRLKERDTSTALNMNSSQGNGTC